MFSALENGSNFQIHILVVLVQINGWDGLSRIEEKKLVCAIPRKCVFGWKTYLFGIGGPKMDLTWT